jgi:hypothetical protein
MWYFTYVKFTSQFGCDQSGLNKIKIKLLKSNYTHEHDGGPLAQVNN